MTPAQTRDLAIAGLLATTLAGLGAAAAFGGNWFKTETIKREQLMRKQALEASGRLARANEEREQIGAYMKRYQTYVRIKAIRPAAGAGQSEPEQGERLDWIERVVEAREARALPRIVYTIAARKPYEALAVPGTKLAFYASRMKLDLGLLHEGDFIDYLHRLSNPPAGIFQIEQCTLEAREGHGKLAAKANPGVLSKPGLAAGLSGTQANVSATCEIDWITLVEEPRTGAAGAAK